MHIQLSHLPTGGGAPDLPETESRQDRNVHGPLGRFSFHIDYKSRIRAIGTWSKERFSNDRNAQDLIVISLAVILGVGRIAGYTVRPFAVFSDLFWGCLISIACIEDRKLWFYLAYILGIIEAVMLTIKFQGQL